MKIIVASNNLFRRELSSFILSEAGYTVHEVSDSAALVRCLERIRPALIVLDAHLDTGKRNGHGNGMEADMARSLRHTAPTTPVILLSCRQQANAPRSGLILPGAAQIEWPYQPDELLAHVQVLLSNHPEPSRIPAAAVCAA